MFKPEGFRILDYPGGDASRKVANSTDRCIPCAQGRRALSSPERSNLPSALPLTSTWSYSEGEGGCASPAVTSDYRERCGAATVQPHVLADRADSSFHRERRLQRGRLATVQSMPATASALLPLVEAEACIPWNLQRGDGETHGGPSVRSAVPKSPLLLSSPAACGRVSPTHEATEMIAAEGTAAARQAPLAAEDDEGDVEYKWRLTGVSATRFQHLVTQMQFRVSEGNGQCLYELGVSDDGTPRGLKRSDFDESVHTIYRMAYQLQLEATLLQCCRVSAGVTPAALQYRGRRGSTRISHMDPCGAADKRASDEEEGDEELLCGEILVSRRQSSNGGHDMHIAFCGAVGSGKSTLMAVLLTSHLDDGCGGTRQSLFNHKHELHSGRTSSLASRVWTVTPDAATTSFRSSDSACRASSPISNKNEAASPCEMSSYSFDTASPDLMPPPTPPFTVASPRSITLLDTGGGITKTMLCGLMSRHPDYVCVCVPADTTDVSAVPLCADICSAMNTPFVVVITKRDIVEDFEIDGLIMELSVVLREGGYMAESVETLEAAAMYCREWLPRHREACGGGDVASSRSGSRNATPKRTGALLQEEKLRVPIFCVSSVLGGEGLDLFRCCLSHLPAPPPSSAAPLSSWATPSPFEVLLDYSFNVEGVGCVVRGTVALGPVDVGCRCFVGPGRDGRFHAVHIRGIHVDGSHVNEARVGDEATFALDRMPSAVVVSHKGKVLVRQPERVARAFRAKVQILSQAISPHMEPIMYSRNARQAVSVVAVNALDKEGEEKRDDSDEDRSSAGSGARVIREGGHRGCVTVDCRFLFRPELVSTGDAVVLHWPPRGVAVGRIASVDTDAVLGRAPAYGLPALQG